MRSIGLEAGPVPLYHQLERDLYGRISGGEFAPGQALPTEEQICAQYGVSRITVRRALDALIGQGLIIKRRGVGSFVAERREGVRSVRLSGSLDQFLATAGSLDLRLLSLGEVDPSAEVMTALELAPGDRAVRLELVSSLSAGPVIYLEVFVPEPIGRLLTPADIKPGVPVARVIEQKLKTRITRAEQLIVAALADETAGRHLGIAPSTPILSIRRVYYTAAGRPIEAAYLRHHPERYQYLIELRTDGGY